MSLNDAFRPKEDPPYRVLRHGVEISAFIVGHTYMLKSLLSSKVVIGIYQGQTDNGEYEFKTYDTDGTYRGTLIDDSFLTCEISEIEVQDGFLQDSPYQPAMTDPSVA